MSLRILFPAQNKLTRIFGLIFLCIVYFKAALIADQIIAFFQVSHFLGRIIVNEFLGVCKFTIEAVRLIYSFSQILYEDTVVFIKDATERVAYAIYLLVCVYLCLEEWIVIAIRAIWAVGQTIVNAIGALQHIIVSIKTGILITGSTVWEFLTSAPRNAILEINAINTFIVNAAKDLINLVFTFCDKILECLGKIYFFFFDIPLNSVYGLIIAALILAILYVKFHDICVIISSGSVKLYKEIVSFGINLWTGRFLERRSKMENAYGSEDNERLCIICQDQLKDMIIFPCKHLCLCRDCCLQLTKIRPHCPVCRGKITGTLKVYL